MKAARKTRSVATAMRFKVQFAADGRKGKLFALH